MRKFKNTPNKKINHEGEELWISRPPATVAVIFAIVSDTIFVLTTKRSMLMESPGMQCLPGGYMDWNENGLAGIHREVYEETGLDLDSIKNELTYSDDQPYHVNSEPTNPHQTVSLHYIFEYDFGVDGHYCMLESEKFTSSEVSSVEWVSIEDISNYTWTFGHDEVIMHALNYLDTHPDRL
jgi:8-oxo-dGTP pyrophosphatase MutT (NUDIX family)